MDPDDQPTTAVDDRPPPTDRDHSIDPFRIEIAQSELDDLHARLDRTRWPDELT